MNTNKQILGREGENKAVKYLANAGYRILMRNYRVRRSEVDIVCRDLENLVFVEVKSARIRGYGSAEERITRQKEIKMIEAAYAFLDTEPELQGLGVRFDVIVVNFAVYPAEIMHYQGAFYE